MLTNTKVYNLSDSDQLVPISEQLKNETCEFYFVMDVGEPVTLTTKLPFGRSSSFTSYLIRIETNHPSFANTFSAVRRRYSEFYWLRSQLVKNHGEGELPPLPPKKFMRSMNFNPIFIKERMQGLSTFLQKVLESPTLLSEPTLLFFLQCDLSVEEMLRQGKGDCLMSLMACEEITADDGISNDSEDNPLGLNSFSQQHQPPKFINKLARRLSQESGFSDRFSLDEDNSARLDSGHFEESSGASSQGQPELAKPSSNYYGEVPVSESRKIPLAKGKGRRGKGFIGSDSGTSPSLTDVMMFANSPATCFLLP